MLFITIRTDKPEAEVGVYEDTQEKTYKTWQAHRQLAETIHATIESALKSVEGRIEDVQGVVCYKGPGSFTGLRIGITTANTLAYGLDIPVVAQNGDDWQQSGIARLLAGEDEKVALPEYGSPVHITQPKK